MNKLTLIIIGIFLLIQQGRTQIPGVTWEKEMQVSKSHYFSDVLELPGGNIILAGAINHEGEADFDIWLLELNSSGDTLKTRCFADAGKDIAMRLLLIEDKGYLLAYLNEQADEIKQSRLMAVDNDFNVLWKSELPKHPAIIRSDVAADLEGNIWWLNTVPGEDGKPAVAVTKLGPDGKMIQEISFAVSNPSEGYALRALPDGTMAMSLRVLPEKEKCFVEVVRLGNKGDVLWKTIIPDADKSLTPQCLCCMPGNNLLAGGWAGMCYNPTMPAEDQIWDYDYLLSKIDASGKVLWTKNYNREGSEKGTAATVLPDGKIMAAGKCETSFTGTIGPWLMLVDNDGNKIEDHVFKFRFVRDQVARIICTQDGGLLMVGPGYIESNNRLSGWVRKLNPVL